ncbi:MAG: hypothetical protein ABFD92_10795 [Planctomycetaceae bacterium]
MKHQNLCVSRVYSADLLNHVVNHPEVRPWVGFPWLGRLDLTQAVADPRNVLLMAEGGGFLFIQQEPGIYEVHSQFLPDHRGENVIAAARDAERFMFTRTDCIEIRSKVPHGNVAASAFARKMRYELQFERTHGWPTAEGLVPCKYYARSITQWANQADELKATGHFFHEKLEAAKIAAGSQMPIHEDDDAHDLYVGATVEMIAAGQIAKALGFYARWAAFAGYGPIAVIADNPVVIDIGDALLAVRGDDFDVILTR